MLYEVRYDDDESYHVAARYTERSFANRLRDRLAEAHVAADRDGCHLDGAWTVTEVSVDVVDTALDLPTDLFDVDREGHADVNIDRVDLTHFVESRKLATWLADQ